MKRKHSDNREHQQSSKSRTFRPM